MKAIHTFANQTEGLKYFTNLVIDAANRGWFRTDEVKNLFHREINGWGSGSAESIRRGPDAGDDHCVAEFWGLVCLPILMFFRGVVEGGDNSMFCDFDWNISHNSCKPFVGSLSWFGQGTEGRFVAVIFEAASTARMYYDTGYTYNRETGEHDPKGESGFLGMPKKGDAFCDAMTRQGFFYHAKAQAETAVPSDKA